MRAIDYTLIYLQFTERSLSAEQALSVFRFAKSLRLIRAEVFKVSEEVAVQHELLLPVIDQILNRSILATVFDGQ